MLLKVKADLCCAYEPKGESAACGQVLSGLAILQVGGGVSFFGGNVDFKSFKMEKHIEEDGWTKVDSNTGDLPDVFCPEHKAQAERLHKERTQTIKVEK
jgi:hypothetical protein